MFTCRVGVTILGFFCYSVAAMPMPTAAQTHLVQQHSVADRRSVENGFYVRQYSDGSGSVSTSTDVLADRWSIRCSIDAMSDKLDCMIESKVGGPVVY